jgi:hypothetical protein
MTAQFPDTIGFSGKEYDIAGVNGDGLFTPQPLGLMPVSTNSACWRGYICAYQILDDALILDALNISLGHDEGSGKERRFVAQRGPPINGVSPQTGAEKRSFLSGNYYEGLHLPIHFTGGILAGDGFIQELYVHMGFHPAWKYCTVFELIFDQGRSVEIRDVSSNLEQIRNRMVQKPLQPSPWMAGEELLPQWIEKTLRLDYDLGE